MSLQGAGQLRLWPNVEVAGRVPFFYPQLANYVCEFKPISRKHNIGGVRLGSWLVCYREPDRTVREERRSRDEGFDNPDSVVSPLYLGKVAAPVSKSVV